MRKRPGSPAAFCRNSGAQADAAGIIRGAEIEKFLTVSCDRDRAASRVVVAGCRTPQHLVEICLREGKTIAVFPAETDCQVDVIADGAAGGQIGKGDIARIEREDEHAVFGRQ